jgi:uncharacterized membrane protein
MNFIVWLLVLGVGFSSMYFSDVMVKFWRMQRAENNLGGTRAFYVLLGFIIVIVGLLIMFGVVDLTNDPTTIQYN